MQVSLQKEEVRGGNTRSMRATIYGGGNTKSYGCISLRRMFADGISRCVGEKEEQPIPLRAAWRLSHNEKRDGSLEGLEQILCGDRLGLLRWQGTGFWVVLRDFCFGHNHNARIRPETRF